MSWLLATWAGALALLAALVAVTRPNIVHALLFLLAALIALGAAFFALAADFAGAIQLLIYAGAIVALFVFVVMTVDASPDKLAEERARIRAAWKGPALLAGLALVPILVALLAAPLDGGAPAPATAAALGSLMFGPWAVVTELATLLLLAGMIAVRHIGRRHPRRAPDADTGAVR